MEEVVKEVLSDVACRLHTRSRGTFSLGAFAQHTYAQLQKNAAILLSLGQSHNIGQEFFGMLKTLVFFEIVPSHRAAQPDCDVGAICQEVL